MKKLNLAILVLASIFIFACSGNTENNTEATETSENTTETTEVEENAEAVENDTEAVEAVATTDFDEFWTKFQTAIAKDDKKALQKLCNNQSMKDFISGSYETYVTTKIKEEIAKTKVSEIENQSETRKLFSYSVEHPSEGEETYSSAFGFVFEKKDGKWWISEPHMAG